VQNGVELTHHESSARLRLGGLRATFRSTNRLLGLLGFFGVLRRGQACPGGGTTRARSERALATPWVWSQGVSSHCAALGTGGRASACVRLCPGWCCVFPRCPTSPRVRSSARNSRTFRWNWHLEGDVNHLLWPSPGQWPHCGANATGPPAGVGARRCERSNPGEWPRGARQLRFRSH